jgi:hypothetical protein
MKFDQLFLMNQRLVHTHAPHFELNANGTTMAFKARLHKKMGQTHSHIGVEHNQASDVMAEAHAMTPEEFIELQNAASEAWLKEYTQHLHSGEGFTQRFAFNCESADREDSISAILAKYGQ